MAKVMLAMGLIVAYAYIMENFFAWYSGDPIEIFSYANHFIGFYAPVFYALLALNILVPQTLWFRRIRTSPWILFVISLLINTGMWLERFIIIVTNLSNDFLPSAWKNFIPTFWDYATFIGTLGVFAALFFLFIRFIPVISIFEMRELVKEQEEEELSEAFTD
jgi:molybdopterin-containing oxidoreductase family membrane subunit